MTVHDGIVYKGGQVVVPKKLKEEFLQWLHLSHQGSHAINTEESQKCCVLAWNGELFYT